MSDYNDDDEIDYNNDYDEYDYAQNEEDGLNLEDNFIEAENSPNPIDCYKQIIELEISNSNSQKWSYKSYEKLCQLYIKSLNFQEFKNCLDKLFEIYPKIDDNEKQDTIRNIVFTLRSINDTNFIIKIYEEMLEQLKSKDIQRPYMDTGLRYAKFLLSLNNYNSLRALVPELMDYVYSQDESEDIIKSIKLELIILKIQLCKVDKKEKEIKPLYLEATDLMKDLIFDDKLMRAIINEEGGKIDMNNQNYDSAVQKFKNAFHNYRESGSNQAISALKYAYLASMMVRNSSIIVSPEEANIYKGDTNLSNLVELLIAYENMDIASINKIWNNKVLQGEKDNFIIENKDEIMHSIRINYIINKLNAYRVCKFDTLMKEIGVSRQVLVEMLLEIKNNYKDDINFGINLIDGSVQVKGSDGEGLRKLVRNYDRWLKLMK